MRIDSNSAAVSALTSDQTDALRTRIQLQLLKKQLDLQQSTAQQLLESVNGKGQVLDIRV